MKLSSIVQNKLPPGHPMLLTLLYISTHLYTCSKCRLTKRNGIFHHLMHHTTSLIRSMTYTDSAIPAWPTDDHITERLEAGQHSTRLIKLLTERPRCEANEREVDIQPACWPLVVGWLHHELSVAFELANHDALFPIPSLHESECVTTTSQAGRETERVYDDTESYTFPSCHNINPELDACWPPNLCCTAIHLLYIQLNLLRNKAEDCIISTAAKEVARKSYRKQHTNSTKTGHSTSIY